ncbi:SDR family oxidoreductase [Luteimonas huabeiensis]|uniref:SDR family oxidoreductase n=1 Tax=Luteimonas huabeiensis TaxID=1244513 RepID=UPI0004678F9A|nr:SDR family oxidoreductase [Luteimonas huabeiensis]
MQRVLIIGATSAIAEAAARRFAARGAAIHLLGRQHARLQAIADDLGTRGARVSIGILDVNDVDEHGQALDAAWTELGGVDVALIAHGTLPDQDACDASVDLALREFETNGTATIALCAALAQRLRAGSTLTAISSVAGDRGRASNYLYGSAKAAVSAYLSGLGQRLRPSGINVLTVKPGFVDTPMTASFQKGPLWATPDRVGRGIVRAIDRRKAVVYLPAFWWAIMYVIRAIPEPIFRRIRL